jgi:hypothetical protein
MAVVSVMVVVAMVETVVVSGVSVVVVPVMMAMVMAVPTPPHEMNVSRVCGRSTRQPSTTREG